MLSEESKVEAFRRVPFLSGEIFVPIEEDISFKTERLHVGKIEVERTISHKKDKVQLTPKQKVFEELKSKEIIEYTEEFSEEEYEAPLTILQEEEIIKHKDRFEQVEIAVEEPEADFEVEDLEPPTPQIEPRKKERRLKEKDTSRVVEVAKKEPMKIIKEVKSKGIEPEMLETTTRTKETKVDTAGEKVKKVIKKVSPYESSMMEEKEIIETSSTESEEILEDDEIPTQIIREIREDKEKAKKVIKKAPTIEPVVEHIEKPGKKGKETKTDKTVEKARKIIQKAPQKEPVISKRLATEEIIERSSTESEESLDSQDEHIREPHIKIKKDKKDKTIDKAKKIRKKVSLKEPVEDEESLEVSSLESSELLEPPVELFEELPEKITRKIREAKVQTKPKLKTHGLEEQIEEEKAFQDDEIRDLVGGHKPVHKKRPQLGEESHKFADKIKDENIIDISKDESHPKTSVELKGKEKHSKDAVDNILDSDQILSKDPKAKKKSFVAKSEKQDIAELPVPEIPKKELLVEDRKTDLASKKGQEKQGAVEITDETKIVRVDDTKDQIKRPVEKEGRIVQPEKEAEHKKEDVSKSKISRLKTPIGKDKMTSKVQADEEKPFIPALKKVEKIRTPVITEEQIQSSKGILGKEDTTGKVISRTSTPTSYKKGEAKKSLDKESPLPRSPVIGKDLSPQKIETESEEAEEEEIWEQDIESLSEHTDYGSEEDLLSEDSGHTKKSAVETPAKAIGRRGEESVLKKKSSALKLHMPPATIIFMRAKYSWMESLCHTCLKTLIIISIYS